jgi:hypothetical protein
MIELVGLLILAFGGLLALGLLLALTAGVVKLLFKVVLLPFTLLGLLLKVAVAVVLLTLAVSFFPVIFAVLLVIGLPLLLLGALVWGAVGVLAAVF